VVEPESIRMECSVVGWSLKSRIKLEPGGIVLATVSELTMGAIGTIASGRCVELKSELEASVDELTGYSVVSGVELVLVSAAVADVTSATEASPSIVSFLSNAGLRSELVDKASRVGVTVVMGSDSVADVLAVS